VTEIIDEKRATQATLSSTNAFQYDFSKNMVQLPRHTAIEYLSTILLLLSMILKALILIEI
jgi:hypothetical protein